jgi:hypothetical protein
LYIMLTGEFPFKGKQIMKYLSWLKIVFMSWG